jgi:hypothetical protein
MTMYIYCVFVDIVFSTTLQNYFQTNQRRQPLYLANIHSLVMRLSLHARANEFYFLLKMFILQCHKVQNNRQLLQKRDRNNVHSSRFLGRPLTDPHEISKE